MSKHLTMAIIALISVYLLVGAFSALKSIKVFHKHIENIERAAKPSSKKIKSTYQPLEEGSCLN